MPSSPVKSATHDDWAMVHTMRQASRPSTSYSSPNRSTKTSKSRCGGHRKVNNTEEPHTDDAATEEPVFRSVACVPRPPAPRSSYVDNTRQLTVMLGFAEEKLGEQLLIACEKGKKHAVYLLLHQRVVDRDRCRGLRGFTPVHHAATRGHLDVLQLLLDFGWDVNARNDAMETALHLACYSGHTTVVEFLLDHGADVNAVTSDDETPLFYASRKAQYRIVRLLIRRECDISVRNRYGDIAEDEAIDEKTSMEFVTGREDVERLYRRGSCNTKSTLTSKSAFRGEVTLTQQQREVVLSYLDLKSLCKASQVSYRWHRAADSPALWRRLGVSRWELLLQTTVGIGAVTPMSMVTTRGPLQLNTASLVGSVSKHSARRPSSCDHSQTATMAKHIGSTQSSRFIGQRRPQTARSPLL